MDQTNFLKTRESNRYGLLFIFWEKVWYIWWWFLISFFEYDIKQIQEEKR